MVEHLTENQGVASSNLALGTNGRAMIHRLPTRFRPIVEDVVRRMAAGDWDGLVRDGLAPASRTGQDLAHWVHQYPGRLVALPPEAWDFSEHGRVDVEPETWWVVVPLWTAEQGRSDLSLEATIRERSGRVLIDIDNVHVL